MRLEESSLPGEFLLPLQPEGQRWDDAGRLATIGAWIDHFQTPRFDHAYPWAKEIWAEIHATRDALLEGWTSQDPALDATMAIADMQNFTDGSYEVLQAQISRIQDDLRNVKSGELIASYDRNSGMVRLAVLHSTSSIQIERLGVLSHADDPTLVVGSGLLHARTSGVECVAVNDRDFPLHGVFQGTGEFQSDPFMLDSRLKGRGYSPKLPRKDVRFGNSRVGELYVSGDDTRSSRSSLQQKLVHVAGHLGIKDFEQVLAA